MKIVSLSFKSINFDILNQWKVNSTRFPILEIWLERCQRFSFLLQHQNLHSLLKGGFLILIKVPLLLEWWKYWFARKIGRKEHFSMFTNEDFKELKKFEQGKLISMFYIFLLCFYNKLQKVSKYFFYLQIYCLHMKEFN